MDFFSQLDYKKPLLILSSKRSDLINDKNIFFKIIYKWYIIFALALKPRRAYHYEIVHSKLSATAR